MELIIQRPETREKRAEWLHRFCERTVRTMGIRLRLEGNFPRRGAILSNHMGYLDIMSFAALYPVVFVSKMELKNIPIIGWMTTMAGTVFVERGRGGSAERASSEIRATADAGVPTVFFPEGTTSNGRSVNEFHSGILTKVREADEAVTAAFVRYRFTQDNGPDRTLEDDVCYWGDEVKLFPHVFRLVALRGIEVTIRIADAPIHFSAPIEERKEAAAEARAAVLEVAGAAREAANAAH
jgi:1-acyl-sn-glycerol-3-phosphate acyltransferase